MAWFKESSKFQFGKYKGKKVKEVDDANYISWLHHSKYNIYFRKNVLDRLNIKNSGKTR